MKPIEIGEYFEGVLSKRRFIVDASRTPMGMYHIFNTEDLTDQYWESKFVLLNETIYKRIAAQTQSQCPVKQFATPTPGYPPLANTSSPKFKRGDIVARLSDGKEREIITVSMITCEYGVADTNNWEPWSSFDLEHILKSEYTQPNLPALEVECSHEWKEYTGLFEGFTYCTKCDARREIKCKHSTMTEQSNKNI